MQLEYMYYELNCMFLKTTLGIVSGWTDWNYHVAAGARIMKKKGHIQEVTG